MDALRTRTWPWFLLAAVIFVAGVFVIGGDTGAILTGVAAVIALAAAIRAVGLAVRDDPARQRLLGRGAAGIGAGHGMGLLGAMLHETKGAKNRDHGSAEREQPLPAERKPWP
jgi:hypothetical protein